MDSQATLSHSSHPNSYPKSGYGRVLSPGMPDPLGATLCKGGINFAVHSQTAQEIRLVLFSSPEDETGESILLENKTGDTWHVHVGGLGKGQLYAFRAKGEYDPAQGLRFNDRKLLLDPYAKALHGKFTQKDNLLLGYAANAEAKDFQPDTRDNTAMLPKCVAWDDAFDWQGDKPPAIPQEKTVIYEVHVKGFTAHASAGARNPGSYLGVIEKIPYLKELGITAVELLPVHARVSEDFLEAKSLTNYWGYNTIGFFAPEPGYAVSGEVGAAIEEFKTMVRELHNAGIEVILDVVYNHTAEGNEGGPTLSFKGLDNPNYYSLCGESDAPKRFYRNYSGTGNTLNAGSPVVQRLVLDSLIYWSKVMHVDGFRFDLATTLGRDADGKFEAYGHLMSAIASHPELRWLKLIAEPWDIEAYEVGSLPPGWSEWNGKFRDCVRKFVKGDPGQMPELAQRISGSPDLFGHNGRHAVDSVNFITCHDGFTLHDLVAYDEKHNEANQEQNRDGTNENNSWNCGIEGETEDGTVHFLRNRQAKNLLCQLFFSLGMPMLNGGDEFLRTQRGNNNVYAQDNELAWLDWSGLEKHQEIFRFAKMAIAFRAAHAVLRRKEFFQGEDRSEDGISDVTWIAPDGRDLDWDDPEQRCLGFLVDGAETDEGNEMEKDYALFIVYNADAATHDFKLPPLPEGKSWRRVVDTALPMGEDFRREAEDFPLHSDHYLVSARTCIVLTGKSSL
jgi:isoamylase